MNNKFSKNIENSFEKEISSNFLNLKANEKKAIELIRSGRLEDAARVYTQLIEAGSKMMKAMPANCYAKNSRVYTADGSKSVSYKEILSSNTIDRTFSEEEM